MKEYTLHSSMDILSHFHVIIMKLNSTVYYERCTTEHPTFYTQISQSDFSNSFMIALTNLQDTIKGTIMELKEQKN